MDKEDRIKLFIVARQKYFPDHAKLYMKTVLQGLDEDELYIIESTKYHNPQLIFFVSYFFGFFGIDRFMINNVALGLLKLFTLGGLFIWYFVDWLFILKATQRANLELFNETYKRIAPKQKN